MTSAGLCTWRDFSLTDVERLVASSSNRDDLRQFFCEKLNLDGSGKVKQDLIQLDLYTYASLFGIKQHFTTLQISTLLSIIKKVHVMSISTVFDNQSQVLSYFQELLIRHSVNRPPFSACIFSPIEVKKINEYVLSTYFKHYKLYKYAFTKRVHLNLSLQYAGDDKLQEIEIEQVPEDTAEDTVEQEEEEKPSEESTLEPADSNLKQMITSGLMKLVEQEQERLQSKLADQESRLVNRIVALEAAVETKVKPSSGKKKTKT